MTTQEIELISLKTNHILHLILSILTGGIWLIVWLVVASNNADKRKSLVAEINNDTSYKKPMNVLVSIFIMVTMILAIGAMAQL